MVNDSSASRGPAALYTRDLVKQRLKQKWKDEQVFLKQMREVEECLEAPVISEGSSGAKPRYLDDNYHFHKKIALDYKRKERAALLEREVEQLGTPQTTLTKDKNERLLKKGQLHEWSCFGQSRFRAHVYFNF